MRDISTSLVEGCAITSLHFDTGLGGKDFRAEASLCDPHEGMPGLGEAPYRAVGEVVPGSGGN